MPDPRDLSAGGSPTTTRGPFRLEWRIRSGGDCPRLVGSSATVRDATEAARLVAGVAATSCLGEYRLRASDGKLVYTTAAGIEEWRTGSRYLPREAARSLWRVGVEREGRLAELLTSVRASLVAAARVGLVSDAAVSAALDIIVASSRGTLPDDEPRRGRLAFQG